MAVPSEKHVWWLKRITRLMKKRIDKESPPMPPSDPAAVPPPEWAVKMSESFWGDMDYPEGVEPLARLLASVRESTLREAAVEGATAATEGRSVSIAIHALIHTPPSGGGAG